MASKRRLPPLAALAAALVLLAALGCGPSRDEKEAAVQAVKSAVEDCLQRMAQGREKDQPALVDCQCAGQKFQMAFHPQDNRLYLLKGGAAVEALSLTVRGIRVRLSDQGGSFQVTTGGGG